MPTLLNYSDVNFPAGMSSLVCMYIHGICFIFKFSAMLLTDRPGYVGPHWTPTISEGNMFYVPSVIYRKGLKRFYMLWSVSRLCETFVHLPRYAISVLVCSERNHTHPSHHKAPYPARPPIRRLQFSLSTSPLVCYCRFSLGEGRPVDAVATALVFFHKFYMLHSFHRHERLFVGSACLFLAAKVEVRPLCASQTCPAAECTHTLERFVRLRC